METKQRSERNTQYILIDSDGNTLKIARNWNNIPNNKELVWINARESGQEIDLAFTRDQCLDLMRAIAETLASYDDD